MRSARVPSIVGMMIDPGISFILLRENDRGVAHLRKPFLSHLKKSNVIGGTEAVFHRAKQTVAMLSVSFEIEDTIDDMLKDARPCDLA